MTFQDSDMTETLSNVTRALPSLQKIAQHLKGNTQNLLDGDEEQGHKVRLICNVDRIAESLPAFTAQAQKVPLPHSVHRNPSILMIVKDGRPVEGKKHTYASIVKNMQLEGVETVLTMRQLKSKQYAEHKDKQKLRDTHDIVLVDKRIVVSMPSILGQHFYSGNSKKPLTIKFSEKKEVLQKNVANIVNSTWFFGQRTDNLMAPVGLTSFTPEQLKANTEVLLARMRQFLTATGVGIVRVQLQIESAPGLSIFDCRPPIKIKRRHDDDEGEEAENDISSDEPQVEKPVQKKARKSVSSKKGNSA